MEHGSQEERTAKYARHIAVAAIDRVHHRQQPVGQAVRGRSECPIPDRGQVLADCVAVDDCRFAKMVILSPTRPAAWGDGPTRRCRLGRTPRNTAQLAATPGRCANQESGSKISFLRLGRAACTSRRGPQCALRQRPAQAALTRHAKAPAAPAPCHSDTGQRRRYSLQQTTASRVSNRLSMRAWPSWRPQQPTRTPL